MTTETDPILSAEAVSRKIRRMAFEIAERNAGCSSLILAGVQGNGVVLAKKVMEELKKIASCPIHFVTIQINKKEPLGARLDKSIDLNDQTIIVVDDVADTGRILMFALKPFLQYTPRSIQTLVLVERSHKLFPVQTDYVGLSLATTLQEHIRVKTEGEEVTGAWLF